MRKWFRAWVINHTVSILRQRLNAILDSYNAATIDDIEDIWDRVLAHEIDNAIELLGDIK